MLGAEKQLKNFFNNVRLYGNFGGATLFYILTFFLQILALTNYILYNYTFSYDVQWKQHI